MGGASSKYLPSTEASHPRMEGTRGDGAHRLVLLGGGHTHAHTIKAFTRATTPAHVRRVVISESATAFYSGSIPGTVARLIPPHRARIPLAALCEWAGWELVVGRAERVDVVRAVVVMEDGREIGYDTLSIDIGSTIKPTEASIDAVAVPTRPISRLEARVEAFEDAHSPLQLVCSRVVVVGGGPAGVELALGLEARFRQRYGEVAVTLIDRNATLLKSHGSSVSNKVAAVLASRNVQVLFSTTPHHVSTAADGAHTLHVVDATGAAGESLPFDMLVTATGPAPHALLGRSNLPLTAEGWVDVLPTLQVAGVPNVFAAGDTAALRGLSVVRAGVTAVTQGPTLTANLQRALDGSGAREGYLPYKPKNDRLQLMMAGDGSAIISWKGIGGHAEWLWQWKESLDAGWMALYEPARLPPPPEARDSAGERAGEKTDSAPTDLESAAANTDAVVEGTQGERYDDVDEDQVSAITGLTDKEVKSAWAAHVGASSMPAPLPPSVVDDATEAVHVSPAILDETSLIGPSDLHTRLRSDTVVLLDVRPENEYARWHLPGAINVPLWRLRDRVRALEVLRVLAGNPLVVTCTRGVDAQLAVQHLRTVHEDGLLPPAEMVALRGGLVAYRREVEPNIDVI